MWADLYTRGTVLTRLQKTTLFEQLQKTCEDLGAEIRTSKQTCFLQCKAKTTRKTFGHKYLVLLTKKGSGTLLEIYYNLVGMRGGPYKDFIEKFLRIFTRRAVLESAIRYDVVTLSEKRFSNLMVR